MPIMSHNRGGDFEVAPAGSHLAVCCDVIDKGLQDTPWGKKEKVQIRWQLQATRGDGRRHMVLKDYTNSLNEKSNLRAVIEGWIGRLLTDEEVEEGIDLERFIGMPCVIHVLHKKKQDGGVFPEPRAIMPPMPNTERLKVVNYERESSRGKSGREQRAQAPIAQSSNWTPPISKGPPPGMFDDPEDPGAEDDAEARVGGVDDDIPF